MQKHLRSIPREEWPTLFLIFLVYALFFAGTRYFGSATWWLAVPLLAFVIALHSSLQHEVIHGHPSKIAWLNAALVFPAIGIFVPYIRFRDMHLAHHFDPNLTDPYDDPETNYYDPVVWQKLPKWQKNILNFNNILLGRLTLGPALGLWHLYRADIAAMWRGETRVVTAYILHLAALAPVLAWMVSNAALLPVWAWLLSAYTAMSVLKLRTFLEHRAHEHAAGRSVIIEDRGVLALIFLNNNYHAVHHAHPKIVWHKLPAVFAARRETFLKRNRYFHYRSYQEILRSHFLSSKDPVAHPLFRRKPNVAPLRAEASRRLGLNAAIQSRKREYGKNDGYPQGTIKKGLY